MPKTTWSFRTPATVEIVPIYVLCIYMCIHEIYICIKKKIYIHIHSVSRY